MVSAKRITRKCDLQTPITARWVRAELVAGNSCSIFDCGSVRIDLGIHVAWLSGQPVGLRLQEERLLRLLCANPNQIVLTDLLITALYGPICRESGRVRLRRLVADIRSRLGADVASRLCTVSKRGLVLFATAIENAEQLRP
jgi:DNA-binding response OmpR family regulator